MVGWLAAQLYEMKGGPALGELGVVRIRWLPRPARDALANALQDVEMLEMVPLPERAGVHGEPDRPMPTIERRQCEFTRPVGPGGRWRVRGRGPAPSFRVATPAPIDISRSFATTLRACRGAKSKRARNGIVREAAPRPQARMHPFCEEDTDPLIVGL